MNKPILVTGLAVTAALTIVFALSFGKDPRKVDSPLIGRAAPSFKLVPVSGGEPVTFESIRGKPLILNFWATWCRPCVDEHRVLTNAARSSADGVQFLGIVYEDTQERILDFLRRAPSNYPTLVDDAGKTAIAYGVYGVPETFFISADGVIVAKHEGPLDPMTLAAYRRKLTQYGAAK